MEYVYTALLLHKAGQKVTEDSVKKVLTAAGVNVDDARVKALIAALEGVDIDEAVKKQPVAAAAPVQEAAAAPAEETKEEKKEEKKDEGAAAAGLGALFG
jgi:large subunit ribosomal protein L12